MRFNWRRCFQFSLRTFLVASVLVGGVTAWIARSRAIYLDEQALVAELVEQAGSNHFVAVTTNGKSRTLQGTVLM